MDEAFRTEVAEGFAFDEPCLVLGRPVLGALRTVFGALFGKR